MRTLGFSKVAFTFTTERSVASVIILLPIDVYGVASKYITIIYSASVKTLFCGDRAGTGPRVDHATPFDQQG